MLDRLAPEQKQAGAAALGLVVALFLPWYEKNVFEDGALVSGTLNAFGVVSFVEAAIMLVAAGVLALLWARAQRRGFHLPGGDGTVIMGAGLWTMFLIFYRQFDRPNLHGVSVDVSVNWGIFIAFLLGALLAYAGYRIRAAHVPEPITDDAPPPTVGRPVRRPALLRRAGRVPPPTAQLGGGPPPDADKTIVARGRPRPRQQPPEGDGQLSFDEPAEYRPPPR